MSRQAVREMFAKIYERYHQATRAVKGAILDEFCATTGQNRKYVIRKLQGSPPDAHATPRRRQRGWTYPRAVLAVVAKVWEAANYPCGVRLKAILHGWQPWIHRHFPLPPAQAALLRTISARQLDRRLRDQKRQLKRRLYGRTKPGRLLKHHIPIKTDHWDVTTPGWTEMDTVAHCGNRADGEYAYTVNQTDILTTWVESRAVLGKGERGVVAALDAMATEGFPFPVKGYDSDNGSEFVNWHLHRYCQARGIQPWRSRPYKKDDQAHIEQKNWTHVRKLIGYGRYDTPEAVTAMNTLYRGELRLFMNLCLPSVKLQTKIRKGARLTRRYDTPQTPFERVLASGQGDPAKVAALQRLRETLDPFALAHAIDQHLTRIWTLANQAQRLKALPVQASGHGRRPGGPARSAPPPVPQGEREALQEVARLFGGTVLIRGTDGRLHPVSSRKALR